MKSPDCVKHPSKFKKASSDTVESKSLRPLLKLLEPTVYVPNYYIHIREIWWFQINKTYH